MCRSPNGNGRNLVSEMLTVFDLYGASGNNWGQIAGHVENYPSNIGCEGTNMESTVQFDFQLPQDVFNIPFDDSCQLSVWVVIDLFYCGITRPDGLIPVGNTPCVLNLLEVENELLQVNSESGGEEVSFGISRSLTTRTFISVGGRRGGVEVVGNEDVLPVVDEVPISDVTQDKASAVRAVPVFMFLSLLLFVFFC
eukprot:TRINITY_DN0_c10_g1_i1.p1 TRINITY_DN0_c10_g1~~TRINITY_DN0_c10_g1_i1.p1  ORF type:complete len:196 (-),score=22.78 TRINITY_DN0_c10_g1_i1:102-689(-)